MKAPLLALQDGLKDLRVQLELARLTLDLAEIDWVDCEPSGSLARLKALETQVRSNSTEFRVHQYRSAIVALYGLLERFVESLTELVADRMADIAENYQDLPEKLRDSHLALTLEVMQRRSEQRLQDVVSVDDFVAALHSCHSGNSRFRLNSVALSYHAANCRHQVTIDLLSRCAVSPQVIDASPSLSAVVTDRFPGQDRYAVIDDLAARRNEISHGSATSMLSMSLLHDYIDVVEAYGLAVSSAAVSSLSNFAITQQGRTLGRPDEVFNNRILGFESLQSALRVGDTLGYRRGDGRCGITVIESLQVEGVDRDSVAAGERTGVATPLRCNRQTEVFLLPSSMRDLDSAGFEVFD